MGGLAFVGGAVKLAAVMGLLLLTLRMVGRLNGRPAAAARTDAVRVVTRSSLGRNASLVVVRVGAKDMVLGVTDHGVNLLSEVAVADAGPEDATPAGTPGAGDRQPWRDLLDTVRDRTVRR